MAKSKVKRRIKQSKQKLEGEWRKKPENWKWKWKWKRKKKRDYIIECGKRKLSTKCCGVRLLLCTKREKLSAEEVSHRMRYKQKTKNKWLQLCAWSVYLLEDGRKKLSNLPGTFFPHKIFTIMIFQTKWWCAIYLCFLLRLPFFLIFFSSPFGQFLCSYFFCDPIIFVTFFRYNIQNGISGAFQNKTAKPKKASLKQIKMLIKILYLFHSFSF